MVNQLSVTEIYTNDRGFEKFFKIGGEILHRHGPLKKKYIRENQSSFMNKTWSNEIMKRTKLRNNFLKNRTKENGKKYSKQRNFCIIIKKTKAKLF